MATIEKKIKTVITSDEWFIANHPSLKPAIGGYSKVGNTYPSIAYTISNGQSEPIIPAERSTLVFVIYSDKRTKSSYGELKKISDRLLFLFNRKPQNLTDIAEELRVVGCYKDSGEEFFNDDISKHGRDLKFNICLSEDEDFSESSSSSSSSE